MVQMPPNPSALDTLRQFTDDQVLALLGARPDLATPPPGSLPGLAARALTRPSVERALSGLDTFQLQALEAAAVLDHSLRSEEHTSELQSRGHLVCRLLL